ncbi:MAG: hypothetical protein AAF658_22130, partial [Myxococcota bacterium]
IGALGDAINAHGYALGLDETWSRLRPSVSAVSRDAGFRVVRLLRDFDDDTASTVAKVDSRRYLFEFGIFLRQVWSVAVAAGEIDEFYAQVGPALASISRIKDGSRSTLATALSTSLQELLLDIGMERSFGAAPVDLESGKIESLMNDGFERLKSGVGSQARVNWDQLAKIANL